MQSYSLSCPPVLGNRFTPVVLEVEEIKKFGANCEEVKWKYNKEEKTKFTPPVDKTVMFAHFVCAFFRLCLHKFPAKS